MLSSEEIRKLLDLLGHEVVVEEAPAFPYRVTRRKRGYSDDPIVGALQAKLSVMLEAASRAEAR